MFFDPTTLNLAVAQHRTQVCEATLRQVRVAVTADHPWSRRTARPSVWQIPRHR